MKLLLKEDVDGLGFCGDEVEVKDGYGRNYLIPQGKAILATPRNVKAFNHQKSIVLARVRKLKNAAADVAGEIGQISLTVTKKVGDQGKLYGSVTTQEIGDLLREKGIEIDRRKILLSEPIRSLGEFKVPIKLHPEVTGEINVTVVAEAVPEEEKEAAPAPATVEEKKEEPEAAGETQ